MNTNLMLRTWALQADTIASLHCSHHYRTKLIHALINQITEQRSPNCPLWLICLTKQLEHILYTDLDHTEVRATLNLFRDTCHHLVENRNQHWLSYANDLYDQFGNPYTPPRQQDPLASALWLSADDDDTKPIPELGDSPL